MKKILLFSFLFFAALAVKAQTYLSNGDYVTISYTSEWGNAIARKYLETSISGVLYTNSVNDNCLLQLEVVNGDYRFKDVTTDLYLKVNNNGANSGSLILTDKTNASLFKFANKGSVQGQYMFGQLYYNATMSWGSIVALYLGENFTTASWFNQFDMYIEKWEKHGGGDATSHFNPDKVVFDYAHNDSEAQAQKKDVSFVLETSSQSYYKCVCREEILIGKASESLDPSKVTNVQISWVSSSAATSTIDLSKYNGYAEGETNRELMTLSAVTNSDDKWQFTITPKGKSPMGLQQLIYEEDVNGQHVGTMQYVDYVDWVIVSYEYDGKPFTQQMRVVRKSYHEEQLPTLTFSINPLTYTFAQGEESKEFEVVAMHQHGSVIYSVEKQAVETIYESGYDPKKVTLTTDNLTLTLDRDWGGELSAVLSGDQIKVTAKANNTGVKRSAVLTGTLCPVIETNHPCEKFTINLHQRYENVGIELKPNIGKGNTKLQENMYGRKEQAVHTAERTIYYDNTEDIELRLPEAGYSGYMRWYDYKTNGSPNYNHCHKDENGEPMTATTWALPPQSASGEAFAAINTPADKKAADEKDGYSLGLYALNKSAKGSGGESLTAAILNEDANDNPAPRIRPWSDNGYHIMACDVSAYTDYEVVVENGQIKSITEPTLSYRQLFHLRPASEMAERFKALKDGEFLETYSYQAPAGKSVLLATEYRFHKYRSHISEMCYFYYDKGGAIKRITDKTNVVWTEYTMQSNGSYDQGRVMTTPNYTAALDYLKVQEDRYPTQKKYTLTVPAANANTNKDLLIASFEVKFLDIEQYGPTEKIIITQERIEADYKSLAKINFDEYNSEDKHLPWDYTSYGYVYDVAPLNDNGGQYKRGASQGVFPFYGEYTVVERVDKDWAKSAAHSGKALYVDGTMEPGLVATISAPTNICSGQTVYCSAWFRNPRPNNNWAANGQTGNPIFRCNIQGRSGDGEWEDAGVYFVGELAIGSNWQQVVFPIESAHSYDETRVSIYNFATTNQGNDFMVDDINLYVSRLPIAAYQGKMTCRSSDASHTRAAAVLRLDYSNINVGDARYMYYRIFNNSYEWKDANGQTIKGKPVELKGNAAYFHEAHLAGEHENHYDFGSVGIPDVDFDPEAYNVGKPEADQLKIYYSVSKLLDDMVANDWLYAKAYVKTENSGVVKWLLYVAHLLDNVTAIEMDENTKNTLPLEKLYDQHSYVIQMAYTPEELPNADCSMTTPIHATQQTVFKLRNSNAEIIEHTQTGDILTAITDKDNTTDGKVYIFDKSLGNCANALYFLTSTVVNHLAVESGQTPDNEEAPIYSDWLVGDPKGDVLSETPPATDDPKYQDYLERLQASTAGFEEMYGYTHGQVSHAIMYDMRRVPTEDEPNPNYSVKTFEELDPAAFESLQNYEIVKHLYENGWLHLYDTVVHFYLGSQDTARYWCFPIAETAKTTIGGKEVTLKDCNEPHRVFVTSAQSDYHLNVAPILQENKTPQQKTQLPTVKVLANAQHNITKVTLPIKEIAEKVNINSQDANVGDNITIDLASALPTYISFFDLNEGKKIDKPSSFEIGKEYTMRLAFQNESNSYHLSDPNYDACSVGYVFFTIQVVPNTLVWQPTGHSFNGWGKNENWKGWNDSNKDGKIENSELTDGFVPMVGSNVVIPNLGSEILYPYIVPEHEHDHYPMAVYHDQHACANIYFAPGAMIQNQHLLHYERAFVDMPLTKGAWHMMSAPLLDMYSGDMFIPHSGGKSVEKTNPFEVSDFRGQRSSSATYAFWASYYNQTVKTWFDNGTTEEVAAAAEFKMSNGLNQKLEPASGYLLWGEGDENELVVRLPKPDNVYYTSGGNKVSVPRANSGKFAFTATHENQQMNITLTNKVANRYFVFGNPTMAYINMAQFVKEHSDVLTGNFYRVYDGSWTATVQQNMRNNEKYLAPMTSVMLEAKAEQTSLNLTLTPSVLTLNDQVAAQSPARRVQARTEAGHEESEVASEMMTIYAVTPSAHARTLVITHPEAYDYYVHGEDALLMTSGVQTSSYVTIPLNLYTAAESVPMMADVRQGVSRIPLSMIVHPEHRTEYMQLAFYLSDNWMRECYIYDSYTGQKVRIMDGLVISVEMPKDYEERYFIEGPDEYLGAGSDNGGGTTTNIGNATATASVLHAYSMQVGQLTVAAGEPIRDMKVYSITGQLLYRNESDCQLSTIHCQVPSGVCVVEATLYNGTTCFTQAIVK